jgi:hypothetical protein
MNDMFIKVFMVWPLLALYAQQKCKISYKNPSHMGMDIEK